MNFLNAPFLAGLAALVGVPLAIHLLNLRFPKLFEFSSVKHIRETVAQRSRIFRWRHLVLLALRTFFALALLFAFLRPMLPQFGSTGTTRNARAVLLVIDHSMSMEHKGGGISSRQRAENEAEKILSTLGADDIANVIVAGATAKPGFAEFTANHAEVRRAVGAIKAGLGRADFSLANATAARLLAKVEGRGEIYYLTDFQRKNWANVDFTALPPSTRIFFVDVAPPAPGNRAILSASLNQAQVLAGDTISLEIEVGNFRDTPMQEPVKVVLDARSTFEKEVAVAPWSTARFTLPIAPGGPGLHQCEVSLAPDDLAIDDRYFLTIPVLEKEGILVVTDAAEAQQDGVRFLETALNPYENLAGSLLPKRVPAGDITETELAAAKKMFVTRAGRLSDAAARLVADFVFHGGGLVYFLDGDSDGANLAALQAAMGTTRLPLTLGARRTAKNIGTGAQQIIRGDFKSRYLRLFRGTSRQNLALLEFYDIYDAAPTGAGNTLLSYADETLAMAAVNHGLGTVLLMNFSVGEFSSNLARQRIFPAWMQDIVKGLASDEPVPAATTIGETVSDEVWKSELAAAPLRRPTGEPLDFRTEALGERVGITFVPEEIGFYTMRAAKLLRAYGVNANPDESDLRPIDRALLPEQLGEKGQKGYFLAGREDFQNLVLGKPIFHWFIIAGVLLLLLELAVQALAARSAPAASPPADSLPK